jgi:membrane protease YdiL (CAAX protease family)
MAITFVATGVFGGVLAYAFFKTSSLLIPIAIHLGWNLVNGFVFSQGPIGNGIFVPVADQPKVSVSYFVFFCITTLPLIAALFFNFLFLRRQPTALQISKRALPGTTFSSPSK